MLNSNVKSTLDKQASLNRIHWAKDAPSVSRELMMLSRGAQGLKILQWQFSWICQKILIAQVAIF